MYRLIMLLLILSGPLSANELNREQVQKCIDDSLILAKGLTANDAEHRQIQQQQVRLNEQHQQLTQLQQQILAFNKRLASCSEGCNHLEAKRRNIMKKFDKGTELYQRDNNTYKKRLKLYQTTLSTHQATFAAYEQRCLDAVVSAMDFDRYCNGGQHDAPFCRIELEKRR